MQITLSNALVLTVKPVSQVAIDVLIGEQGGYAEMARLAAMSSAELSAYFKTLSYDEIKRRDAAQLKEMRYIFGWGVVDTPPPEALDILTALDCNSDIPQIQRANWLIYAAELSRADKSLIIGAVMAVTRSAQ